LTISDEVPQLASELNRVMGFYAFGNTEYVVMPHQAGNDFHHGSLIHEFMHKALAFGSTFGVMQCSLAYLAHTDPSSAAPYREMLHSSIGRSWNVHEGVAMFWEKELVRQLLNDPQPNWLAGSQPDAWERFCASIPDEYRVALEPLESLFCRDDLQIPCREMIVLALAQSAMCVQLEQFLRPIIHADARQFADLLTPTSALCPDHRMRLVLDQLSDRLTMQALVQCVNAHLSRQLGTSVGDKVDAIYLQLTHDDAQEFDAGLRAVVMAWMQEHIVDMPLLRSVDDLSVIAKSYHSAVAQWRLSCGKPYMDLVEVPDIHSPFDFEDAEFITDADHEVKYIAGTTVTSPSAVMTVATGMRTQSSTTGQYLHIGRPSSPTFAGAMNKMGSAAGQGNTVLLFHQYTLEPETKLPVYEDCVCLLGIAQSSFESILADLVRPTVAVAPYSEHSSPKMLEEYSALYRSVSIRPPLLYLPSSRTSYLSNVMASCKEAGLAIEVCGGRSSKGVLILYLTLQALDIVMFAPVPVTNARNFAHQFPVGGFRIDSRTGRSPVDLSIVIEHYCSLEC